LNIVSGSQVILLNCTACFWEFCILPVLRREVFAHHHSVTFWKTWNFS